MNEENVHGIAIYEKKTGKRVEFIKCRVGNHALRVLRGVRINMSPDYRAEETSIPRAELERGDSQ